MLLGDNDDVPAFRWVDKASGTLVTCSNPDDCAAIERARSSGAGLLVDGGTSRGNLLSGEAEAALLTVSRLADEKRRIPATAPSSPTARTSRTRSCSRCGRSASRSSPRRDSAAAT